ncbi:IQ and ubiquitin-like domain-containing protein isoform X3 [Microplitis mediator]|uniref:IQ and ubiquitin-like domain-containing protein isoform X3 n=1 Tax=Microplitis mediator TaxID=375433 RepID=UPI00255431FA|nr:IQ and ubiquitin-like domain-containing protein isoform X3 [Microplitis mediator]
MKPLLPYVWLIINYNYLHAITCRVFISSVFNRLKYLYSIECMIIDNYSMVLAQTADDDDEEKKCLGRWKNLITGKEYFDAATQASTQHRSSVRKNILTADQVTQTQSLTACKYTCLFYDKIIQTSILPDLNDKLLTPSSAARNRMSTELHRLKAKELFSTRNYSKLEEESAIKIQKFFRACRTRTEMSSLARFAILTRTQPPVKEKLVRLNQDKRFEIVERRTPRTCSDFEMLHNMLDRWRVLESEQVDRVLFENSRMAAKSVILLKEIELLRSIELSKSKVRKELKERRNLEFLDKLAKLECWRCGKLLPISELNEDEPSLPTCSSCISIRPSKNPRILYEPYEQMLKDLRKSEAQMGLFDGLAFHIDPRVLHQLVNYIWHGKSGISEFDDLFQLRLLRFRLDVEWSPWNSILLTKREAAVHQAMSNPWDLYESSLVQKFVLRNLQAKLYFSYLVK